MHFFSIVLIFLVFLSPFQKQRASSIPEKSRKSQDAFFVSVCTKLGPDLQRIGWGKVGMQFDPPIRDVEVLGGKPDVDYVRYVIKPKTGGGFLELWFGSMAMSPEPDKELLKNSTTKQERNVIYNGRKAGLDSSGKLKTGEIWRHSFFGISGMEGAEYKSSPENAALFDQIIDSACYAPSMKR